MRTLSDNREDRSERFLPFLIEFAKFFTGFAVLIGAALFALHIANAAL